MIDPLDGGHPARKRWEEFRAQYAAAFLMHWVNLDHHGERRERLEDLWGRLQSSLVDYPELLKRSATEQGEEWDGQVPLHGPTGDIAFWIHTDQLGDLFQSLFPHGLHNAGVEDIIHSSTVVQLHSSLESYAKAIGVSLKKGLPDGVRDHLKKSLVFVRSEMFDALVDCDATRNIIVHNRGIVDDTFRLKVRNPVFHSNELRLLNDTVIQHFASAVWEVAELLQESDNASGAT